VDEKSMKEVPMAQSRREYSVDPPTLPVGRRKRGVPLSQVEGGTNGKKTKDEGGRKKDCETNTCSETP
jgi:hypothetical protein